MSYNHTQFIVLLALPFYNMLLASLFFAQRLFINYKPIELSSRVAANTL